ncbi:MAG: hypothetical protein BRD27_01215 [Bacteroidetes bacterium QH_10_64_19]|nr:MAG: hypothetical protein BRD27_01215 [Bacteroidetes bacterium QH_10_64_19]
MLPRTPARRPCSGRSFVSTKRSNLSSGDSFSPRINDGRMYGRGARDMKASLAAQSAAVRALC